MLIDTKSAIKYGFVLNRNGEKLDEDQYAEKPTVDVTIREIVFKDKGSIKSASAWSLEPQESAYLISEEIINIPKGYVAYVFLKNRLSQKGLLAFNTGIVDAGYYGPISTLITNLSNEKTVIPNPTSPEIPTDDRSFFRITFHKISSEEIVPPTFKSHEKIPNEVYEKYKSWRTKDLERFPESFLDPGKIKKQVSTELTEKLSAISMTRLGLVIGTLGVLFALMPLAKFEIYDNFMKEDEKSQEFLVKRIEKLEKEIQMMSYQIENKDETKPSALILIQRNQEYTLDLLDQPADE